ncbi:MAG: M50 family metallopeptidase [Deltaproteobacteria bacterium]|nr:M50 family metallopeptidase [Deltaproteobacteria bacterium]
MSRTLRIAAGCAAVTVERMFGSLRIGTVRGIPIRLHFTLLVVGFLMLFRFGWLGIPAGFLLFGSVLLHELGHSLVAQRFGLRIGGIDLHLLGGVALMKDMPKNPAQEIAIAVAGPIVSLVLGLVLLIPSHFFGADFAFARPQLADLVGYAAAANLVMAVFNMIPAFPMDGGRVLRAALTTKFGLLDATRKAGRVSRVFAGIFILSGLFGGGMTLALIGVLVWIMVGAEERAAAAWVAHRAQSVEMAGEPRLDSQFVTPLNFHGWRGRPNPSRAEGAGSRAWSSDEPGVGSSSSARNGPIIDLGPDSDRSDGPDMNRDRSGGFHGGHGSTRRTSVSGRWTVFVVRR